MYSEALAACDRAWEFSGGNTEALSIAGYVHAVSGHTAKAEATIHQMLELRKQRYVPPYNVALVFDGLREPEASRRSQIVMCTCHFCWTTSGTTSGEMRSSSNFCCAWDSRFITRNSKADKLLLPVGARYRNLAPFLRHFYLHSRARAHRFRSPVHCAQHCATRESRFQSALSSGSATALLRRLLGWDTFCTSCR